MWLALLWLWSRPAATALIGPLAWELPYATGAALKRQKKNSLIERGMGKKPSVSDWRLPTQGCWRGAD